MQFLIINKDKLVNTVEAQNIDEVRSHEDYKDDYIIVPLEQNQKYENGEIRIKTLLEQYEEGQINKEQYEEIINSNRETEYKESVDSKVIEFMRLFINDLDYSTLSNEQKELLNSINTEVFKIKLSNPKAAV
ncbi:hypothetical protein [Brachyspira sp.]|uniref:hypothetical protein n=1 Tax=Brachyspira sp. TaxID=1977261 RepID=UPI003D7CB6D5